MEYHVIFAGDAICEVGALRKAIVSKAAVPLPDASLLLPHAAPQPLEAHVPVGKDDKPSPCPATSDITGNAVNLLLHCTTDPLHLPAMQPKPHVVVLCFTAASPRTFERMSEVWGRALDRMYPRPVVCVCATRSDALANRKVIEHMKREKVVPIDVEEACDTVIRLRAVSYTEVSAHYNVNTDIVLSSIAKACLGEAERRATPEVVNQLRHGCVQAHIKTLSLWSTRRDNAGKLFYLNRETKKAQWKRPAEYDGEEPELTTEEKVELEMQRQAEEEKRLQIDREQSLLQVFSKEIAEHSGRMGECERRLAALNDVVGRLTVEAEHVKGEIAEMERNRENLERKKEEALHENALFARDSVDVDQSMDREIQGARGRLFELEMVSVLRAEEQFDGDIAESLMINKGLASRLRETLESEVEAQREAARLQAKYDAAATQREHAALEAAKLTNKVVTTKERAEIARKELEISLARERTAFQALAKLREQEGLADSVEVDRHRKQVQMHQECVELDHQISKMNQLHAQRAKNSSVEVQATAAEHERVLTLQKSLLLQLAAASGDAASSTIEAKKRLVEVEYAAVEHSRVASVLLRLRHDVTAFYEAACEQMLQGEHYTPISKTALMNEITQVENAIRVVHKREHQAAAEDVLASLKRRQQLSSEVEDVHQLSRLASKEESATRAKVGDRTVALEQASQEARRVLLEVEARRGSSGGSGEGVVVGPSAASSLTPLERLLASVSTLLCNDPAKLRLLADGFTARVLSKVAPAALTRGEVARLAAATAAAASDPNNSSGGAAPLTPTRRRWSVVIASKMSPAGRGGAGAASPATAASSPLASSLSLKERSHAVADAVLEVQRVAAANAALTKKLASEYGNPASAAAAGEKKKATAAPVTAFRRKLLAKAAALDRNR